MTTILSDLTEEQVELAVENYLHLLDAGVTELVRFLPDEYSLILVGALHDIATSAARRDCLMGVARDG